MSKLICFFQENFPLTYYYKFDSVKSVLYDEDSKDLTIVIEDSSKDSLVFTVKLENVFEGSYTDSDVTNLIKMIYFGNNEEEILEIQYSYTNWR